MMQIQNINFSIIIATFNRAGSLKKTVISVLEQDYQNFEIIISDDASTDGSKEIAEGFKDPRIIYIRNEKNSGLSVTRNSALKKSNGDYLIVIDDDATLKKDFLGSLSRMITDNNASVFCPQILDPVDNKPFIEFTSKTRGKYLGYLDFNCFRGGSHIFSRKVFEAVGYYDERFGIGSKYPAAEESDYYFRIRKMGEKVLYCPELIAYHARENNSSDVKVYNYSYGIAAMLVKNLISDPAHFLFYFFIILYRLTVSAVRALQYKFFPKSIQLKNNIYKYNFFLKGTVYGILDYIRFK